MNKPKNQHWVPRFYLRYFATPETRDTKEPQAWIFSKEDDDGGEILTNTKNICAKRFLYSPKDNGGGRNWILDDKLTNLEDHLSKVWDELANGMVDLSSESVRKALSLFVSIMHLRHPERLEQVKDIHQNIVDLCEGVPETADGIPSIDMLLIDDKEIQFDASDWREYKAWNDGDHQRFFAKMVCDNAIHLAEIMMKKRWSVVVANTSQFITTDKPVSLMNQDREVFGIGTEGTIVSFPLSPTRILTMDDMHSEPANQYYPLKQGNIGAFNYNIWRNGSRFMITGRPIINILREIVSWGDAVKSDDA